MERKHCRATSGTSNAADQRFTDLLIKKGKGTLKMNSNSKLAVTKNVAFKKSSKGFLNMANVAGTELQNVSLTSKTHMEVWKGISIADLTV
ncbi:hypothetical protein D5086_017136 [Populus alba]|uniref:Uncharacterized protein n=1 Tax=Populus alba TaxID=43335 RepID=A0ACC4BXB0_POPAL